MHCADGDQKRSFIYFLEGKPQIFHLTIIFSYMAKKKPKKERERKADFHGVRWRHLISKNPTKVINMKRIV